MDRVEINIYAIVGNGFCVSAEDGQKVNEQIKKVLDRNIGVEISFKNTEMLTSAFLNTAIGNLYGEYEENMLKNSLSVTNISNDDKLLVKRVVDTAKAYFKDPDRFEKSIKKIMEED